MTGAAFCRCRGYKERKRERFRSPDETERLGKVLREAERELPSAITAFRLLLLTGSTVQYCRGTKASIPASRAQTRSRAPGRTGNWP